MTKIIHRRAGAPFALVKSASLPLAINTGFGEVDTEVAVVEDFASTTSGAATIAPVEPSSAKQVLRWWFGNAESGITAAPVIDHSPSGIPGFAWSNTSKATSEISTARLFYTTHDDAPEGAYGPSFYAGDSGANPRVVTETALAKLFGQPKIRFIFVTLPRTWTDRIEGFLASLRSNVNGTSATTYTALTRQPNGSLRVLGQDVPGVFSPDIPVMVEVQFDDIRATVYVNGVKYATVYATSPIQSAITAAPYLHVGNTAGRAFTGYIAYAGVYAGDLSEAEIAWIRNEAKTVAEARTGSRIALPDMPLPTPDGALHFSVLPNTSPSGLQTAGGLITLRPGRAAHGNAGPIAISHRVLFGPLPGQGDDITTEDLTVRVPGEGYLTYQMTADNGINPAITAEKILPVVTSYAALSAANISSRLGVGLAGIFIDQFDAGFPPDTAWTPANVADPGDGTVGLRILKNTVPGGKPNTGGSVQMKFDAHDASGPVPAQIFRVDYYFQLIDTRGPGQAKGYIQTGFTFTNPYTLRRREIDFEYNSFTGRMECSLHLQPNDGGSSLAEGVHCIAPESAFTGQRKWSIVSNHDRIEWFYEDTLLARYVRGAGFDSTVQEFAPNRKSKVRFNEGETYLHPNDAGWHLNPQNVIIQQWMSDANAGWIGPNAVPINHPLFRVSNVDATQFGPANTALQAGDWTAVPGTAGQVVVNVSSYRPAGLGFKPSHLEYSVDGGAWTRLPGVSGSQTISGLTAGSRAIRIRPISESLATNPAVSASNFLMNANASDTKNVTVA